MMMKFTTVMRGLGLQPSGSRVPQEQQEGVYQPLASTTNVHIYVTPTQGSAQHTQHLLDPSSSHADAEILPQWSLGLRYVPAAQSNHMNRCPKLYLKNLWWMWWSAAVPRPHRRKAGSHGKLASEWMSVSQLAHTDPKAMYVQTLQSQTTWAVTKGGGG